MKLKFCIIFFIYAWNLWASDDGGQVGCNLSLDAPRYRSAYLKNVDDRRTFVTIELAKVLDGNNLDRQGLREVRDGLEVVYEDQVGVVRDALDKITKKHARKAPFFLGYVSTRKINRERIALKTALNEQLAFDEKHAQEEKAKLEKQAVASAPAIATALVQDKTEY